MSEFFNVAWFNFRASKKLTEVEEERTNLSVQIKDKDAKIYGIVFLFLCNLLNM